jgi:pimeloyl-ACP methyl ester carboxylesterase
VALSCALDHPDRVAGVVLVSSVGPGGAVSWEDRLLAAPLIGELIAGTAIGGVGLVLGNRRVQDLAGRRLRGRPRDAVVAVGRLTRSPARVWRSFVAEQRALLDELGPLNGRIAAVSAPTVILHGESDHIVAPGVSDRLHRAIAGSSRQVLSGCGHLLPRDRPEAVAAAVRQAAARAG